MITLESQRGRIGLHLTATLMGGDLCVALSGGDRAHIGAVALSQARPSLATEGGTGATTSVLTLLGHKEDELARALASRLAVSLNATVCVACGIHVEAMLQEDLEQIQTLTEELTRELIRQLA